MNESHVHPVELYAKVVEAIVRSNPEVTTDDTGKKFGSSGELKIYNKMFATLSKGKLVVKLSSSRVDELIALGKGERFNPGHGRLMKEWLALEPTTEEDWLFLAKEAIGFVTSKIMRLS